MTSYIFPLSIAGFLQTKEVVNDLMKLVVEETILMIENAQDDEFIPPVLYSPLGKCFNVDYNFLVKNVGKLIDNEDDLGRFYEDFIVKYDGDELVIKNGLFLVANLLEEYYGVVNLNSSSVDMTKYKGARKINLMRRFFNTICYENGSNLKRFRAVHFWEKELEKAIGNELIMKLFDRIDSIGATQVSFGDKQYADLLRDRGLRKIDPVYANPII
jgi:hypothetical protein